MTTLYCAQDLVDAILDMAAGTSDERAVRTARRAANEAYRELPTRRRWAYYYTRAVLPTVAAYSTGTIVYDHTGGTYEREVTLTGGVWPATAARGWVAVGERRYRVSERKSDTVVTLASNYCPSADIASTVYQWFQDEYVLPVDCRAIDQMAELEYTIWPTLMTPGELHNLYLVYSAPSQPIRYAQVESPHDVGRMCVAFGPPPLEAYRFSYVYSRIPPTFRNFSVTTGTLTTTASSTAVTGTGTSFTQSMVGSLIRFGTSSAVPGGIEAATPPVFQGVVKSVESATALTLVEAASDSITNGKYLLSDLADIEPGAMYGALLALAKAYFAEWFPRDDANITRLRQMAERRILQAAETDSRNFGTDLSRRMIWPRLSDMPYTLE